jgi:hypothetical protein
MTAINSESESPFDCSDRGIFGGYALPGRLGVTPPTAAPGLQAFA